MTCPKCSGIYRSDHDLEMPSLVCMICGHRIYCPPPPKPDRTDAELSPRHCVQCFTYPKIPGRSMCKRCFGSLQAFRRERALRAQRMAS